MKKIIFFLTLLFGLFSFSQGAFALDIVSSPVWSQKSYTVSYPASVPGKAIFSTAFGSWYFWDDWNNNIWQLSVNGNYLINGYGNGNSPWIINCSSLFGSSNEYVYCIFDKYSFGWYQSLIIDTKNNVYSRFSENSSGTPPLPGGWFFTIYSQVFLLWDKVYIFDGTYVKQYQISTVGGVITYTLLTTVNKPSSSFWLAGGTIPVHVKISSVLNGFVYQGTDGKNYVVDENFTVDAPYSSSFANALPLGVIGNNGLVLAGTSAGSGSFYDSYVWSSGSFATLLDTSYVLKSFNIFQNPKAYFTTSTNSVVSYDLNCKTQGYDSCRLFSGVYKCANSAGTQSPWGELCAGTVYVWPPPTCSDGIKNQDETSIDYGGVCSCYVHDVDSGKTLLPYRYTGLATSVIDDVKFYNEDVYNIRTGYTISYWDYVSSGFKSRNWLVHSNRNFNTGSLIEVLKNNSGAFVNYLSEKPTLTFTLYSSITFGDEKTTDFESSGSNAINYIRVVTDKEWHLEAQVIKNNGTSSVPDNSEDWGYTRFESSSGSAFLPLGQVTRKFRIVFDSDSPTIFSVDWGSYTRTVASTTVCTPWILTIKTYVNWQVTTSTWQAQFVDSVVTALNNAMINQTGSIVQSEFVCPGDITSLNVPWLGFVSWGFSQHIPLIDYTINVKPFGMLECPLKSAYLFTSKFQ